MILAYSEAIKIKVNAAATILNFLTNFVSFLS